MRSWVSWLIRERLTDIALALALGTALATLAEKVGGIVVVTLAQNVGRNPSDQSGTNFAFDLFYGPYYLNFSLGSTVIAYGPILSALLTLGLVAVVAGLVVHRRDRELGICPACASRIPHESRHCAYCGSGLEPNEP